MELDAPLDLVQIQFFEALQEIFFCTPGCCNRWLTSLDSYGATKRRLGGGQCMTRQRTDALTQGVRQRWLTEAGRSRWKEAEFQEDILCVALLLFVPTQKPV